MNIFGANVTSSQSLFNDIGGAVSDLFQGKATQESDDLKAQGLMAESADYTRAAELARQNEQYTKTSTLLKETAQDREFSLANGRTVAALASSGATINSGDALDIMRSTAQQGAIAHATIGEQGSITEAGYDEQAVSYDAMSATAASTASQLKDMGSEARSNSYLTAGIKGLAGIASLFGG